MLQIRLIRWKSIVFLFSIFIKIYQHNKIIKLNYEKQRLEIKKNGIKKEYNVVTAKLCELKDILCVKKNAQEKWGMEKLKFSQVLTFTGF